MDDRVGVTGAVSDFSLSGFKEASLSSAIEDERKEVVVSVADVLVSTTAGASEEDEGEIDSTTSAAPMKSPLRRLENPCWFLQLCPAPLKGMVGSKSSTRAARSITLGGGLLR